MRRPGLLSFTTSCGARWENFLSLCHRECDCGCRWRDPLVSQEEVAPGIGAGLRGPASGPSDIARHHLAAHEFESARPLLIRAAEKACRKLHTILSRHSTRFTTGPVPTMCSRAFAVVSSPTEFFLMQDIRAYITIAENRDHPVGTLLYAVSCMHCMTTSLAQGGMGLGTMWGEQKALAFLKAAGFTHVEARTLEHDIMNNYYLAR